LERKWKDVPEEWVIGNMNFKRSNLCSDQVYWEDNPIKLHLKLAEEEMVKSCIKHEEEFVINFQILRGNE